jgi:isocitrate dehydrogenase
MATYRFSTVPAAGERIVYANGTLTVPNQPIIPFIEGDGTGPDIWRASVRVFDAAVAKAFGGQKKIHWMEIFAGEKSFTQHGTWLPDETLEAVKEFRVAIKGPLTTPVGGGMRSLNVALRQTLDLYSTVRPVRWFEGVGAPVKDPGKLDIIIFREAVEDVYAGIEYKAGTPEAEKVRSFLMSEMGAKIAEHSAIGIKPVSEAGCKRLMRKAILHAIKHGKPSVTIMHKGNIMKFTEGAFREWAYEVARTEFANQTVAEADLGKPGIDAAGKVVIKDRIADAMFQQLLLRPDEYSVMATQNLNGDYISDAAAAQVGGLGLAPGANIGDGVAVFEATHGTAPKYANLDKINPGSVILSGVMMFEFLGWQPVADLIIKGLENAIRGGRVTYDLARQMPNSTEVSTSAFADAMIAGMGA